jgi:hypothetical protein
MSDSGVLRPEPSAEFRVFEVERGFGVVCTADGSKLFTTGRDSSCVHVINPVSGEVVGSIGSVGDGVGQFKGTRKMCVVSSARGEGEVLFVADQGHNLVHEFRIADGTYLRSIGAGVLDGPHGIVAVTEWTGQRVSVFRRDTGALMYQFGNGSAVEACVSQPCGLVYDDRVDEFIVVDQGHHRLCVFGKSGEFRGSLGSDVGMKFPGDVAFADATRTRLIVADKGGNRILTLDRASGALLACYPKETDSSTVSSPTSVCVTSDGRVYTLLRESNHLVSFQLPAVSA